jgi:hypothetical protein
MVAKTHEFKMIIAKIESIPLYQDGGQVHGGSDLATTWETTIGASRATATRATGSSPYAFTDPHRTTTASRN